MHEIPSDTVIFDYDTENNAAFKNFYTFKFIFLLLSKIEHPKS